MISTVTHRISLGFLHSLAKSGVLLLVLFLDLCKALVVLQNQAEEIRRAPLVHHLKDPWGRAGR